jgi:hypothetical protein
MPRMIHDNVLPSIQCESAEVVRLIGRRAAAWGRCMRRMVYGQGATVAVLSVCLAISTAVPARASVGNVSPVTDAELAAIYQNAIETGVISTEDRARILLRDDADSLIDPINVEFGPAKTVTRNTSAVEASSTTKCTTSDRYVV